MSKILTHASSEVDEVVINQYGPKEYFIFGERQIISTIKYSGRRVWNDVYVEFDQPFNLGETYVIIQDGYEYNLMPVEVRCDLPDCVARCLVNYVKVIE